MTIDEAIEILRHYAEEATRHNLQDYAKAQGLGIEALKRIKEERGYAQVFNYLLLPGETE